MRSSHSRAVHSVAMHTISIKMKLRNMAFSNRRGHKRFITTTLQALSSCGEPRMVLPPLLRMLHGLLDLIDLFFESAPINDQLLKVRRIGMYFTKGHSDLLEILEHGIHGGKGLVETIDEG